MYNLFDIACNFSSDRFDNDLNEVIQRAKNNNVTKFLVVSASLKDTEKVYRIYQDNKDSCFFTIGVHPHHANEFGSLSSAEMIKLIDKYKDQLAMSLATVVNIIDPDVFVFGGGVSNEIDFLDEIKQKMKKFVAGGEFEGTFLKPKFGDASGVRGAARLARTTNY